MPWAFLPEIMFIGAELRLGGAVVAVCWMLSTLILRLPANGARVPAYLHNVAAAGFLPSGCRSPLPSPCRLYIDFASPPVCASITNFRKASSFIRRRDGYVFAAVHCSLIFTIPALSLMEAPCKGNCRLVQALRRRRSGETRSNFSAGPPSASCRRGC